MTAADNRPVINAEAAELVKSATEKIIALQRRAVADVAEIGAELIRVKAAVGQGNFLGWIKAEFDWSERSAQNYMSVAERIGADAKRLSYLPLATVYRLAAPSTPEPVRQSIIERLDKGEVVPASEADAEVREARRNERERRDAERKARAKSPQARARAQTSRERRLAARLRHVEQASAERAKRDADCLEAAKIIAGRLTEDELARVLHLIDYSLPKHMLETASGR